MGRELRRVALDFDWPINKVWSGFLNEHYRKCPDCESGTTRARQRLCDLVSLIMLSGEDAKRGKGHPYFYDAPLHHTAGTAPPSKDMLELTVGLAGREPSRFGHDACDNWSAEKKIISAAGLDAETWGICPTCKGEATDPACKEAYEAWEPTKPPPGDGYQIWETVSEGSPISPVFATPEDLARHMAGTKWGADHGTSYETWLKFINGPGWAPSGVYSPSAGYQNGVDAAVSQL
jgi:hypothetical protein